MENGEKVIGMLCHVTIGLQYRSRECTPFWASDWWGGIYRGDGEILEETSDEAEHPLTDLRFWLLTCYSPAIHLYIVFVLSCHLFLSPLFRDWSYCHCWPSIIIFVSIIHPFVHPLFTYLHISTSTCLPKFPYTSPPLPSNLSGHPLLRIVMVFFRPTHTHTQTQGNPCTWPQVWVGVWFF